jgi:GT2 family glycosyltransferase
MIEENQTSSAPVEAGAVFPLSKQSPVCVVIVTFNRKALLLEALSAVYGQTVQPAAVLVVDNASTDGTHKALEEAGFTHRDGFEHVILERNIGGAGGFKEGVRRAVGYPWVWLMDDDTIPASDALEVMLDSWDRFPPDKKPALLSSKVVWTDGALHPTNVPSLRRMGADPQTAIIALEAGAIPVRVATFVSLLLDGRSIAAHGLPFGDYFIWNDDVEYTARILREGLGVLVPKSIVLHKTPRRQGMMEATPERYYYQVRNVIWMITRSYGWAALERLKIGVNLIRWTIVYLHLKQWQLAALRAVAAGFRDGVLTRPRF